jgi:hypothetical protein
MKVNGFSRLETTAITVCITVDEKVFEVPILGFKGKAELFR